MSSMAQKHGQQYIKDFTSNMERQLGMKVMVLSGHLDTNGTVSLAAYVHQSILI
jgi:hypothetical protein